MPNIEIIENPKRRRRTVKRRKTTTRYKKRSKRRRRNPALATLSNPRRRSYKRRSPLRRRNPKFGFGSLVNIQSAAYVTVGFVTARIAPNLIQKVWPGAPSVGPLSYAVRIAGTLAVAYAAKMVTKKNDIAVGIATGGLAYVLYDAANTYLLPKIGLAGLGADADYLTIDDINRMGVPGGVSGYIPETALSGYQPESAFIDEALAA